MTENKKPWNLATVSGTATTLTEARKYLLIAMRNAEFGRIMMNFVKY